jgi:FkbM family methyltransferase
MHNDISLDAPDDGLSQPRSACVYTTLIGGYEKLNEQPVATASRLPFICLTDDPSLRSETWQLCKVTPLFGMDPVRSQRILKIRPHDYLPGFDCSLYIDNSVILTEPPEHVIERYLGPGGFSLPEHSFRESVLDEFLEVACQGLDDQNRVFEQLNHYTIECPEILQEKPYATGVLLRNHRDPRVRAMLDAWMAHVQRYSRRDQLSANLAFRFAGLKPDVMPIDIRGSWFHSWPHIEGRGGKTGMRAPPISDTPPSARIRKLEQENKALRASTIELTASVEEPRRKHDAIDSLQRELAAERAQKEALRRRATELEESLRREKLHNMALLGSTSWRMMAPGRRAVRLFRDFVSSAQRLLQQISPIGGEVPAASTFGGLRAELHVDPADERGRQLIAAGGALNPNTHRMWQRLLDRGSWTHIVDVGANYGEMLIKAHLPHRAHILAFEPNPVVLPYLKRNLAAAGVKAEIIASAVSHRAGSARLLIDKGWSGMSRLADGQAAPNLETHDVLTVPTTTLSAALGGVPAAIGMRALIKIDVEGHEVSVLQGLVDVLDGMDDFAALVEVLCLSPADVDWIADNFNVELYELASESLVPFSPGEGKRLSESLAGGRFYSNDIALRQKRRL